MKQNYYLALDINNYCKNNAYNQRNKINYQSDNVAMFKNPTVYCHLVTPRSPQ